MGRAAAWARLQLFAERGVWGFWAAVSSYLVFSGQEPACSSTISTSFFSKLAAIFWRCRRAIFDLRPWMWRGQSVSRFAAGAVVTGWGVGGPEIKSPFESSFESSFSCSFVIQCRFSSRVSRHPCECESLFASATTSSLRLGLMLGKGPCGSRGFVVMGFCFFVEHFVGSF